MKEYSPEERRIILEYIEYTDDCTDAFMEYYIEERRREYREDWFEFLEAIDKE